MKTRGLVSLLIMALLCPMFATTTAAEEAEKSPAEETSSNAEKDPARSNKQAKQVGPKKKSKGKDAEKDIFRPSEEISEDFAVPFPVDI